MNDLPNECLLRIFELVEPIGQIAKCRLVCQRWCSVVNSLRLKSLVISRRTNLPNIRWWWRYTPIRTGHLIRSDQTLGSVQLQLNQPLFNSLRTLFVYDTDEPLLGSLNKFQHLVHLEVIYSQLKSETSSECVLSLANLRILNISDAINDRIVLDTPRLTTVKINLSHVEKVVFRFPESVRHFESLRYNEHIKSFVNLETLRIKNINELEDDFLGQLRQLKELHFETKKEIFQVLKQQKRVYRRTALKLFYFGVCLEDSAPDDRLKNRRNLVNERAIKFFHENYGRMADCCTFVHQLNYNDLEAEWGSEIPTDFIGRFVNLEYIIVPWKVKHPDQLIRILSECEGLRSLALDASLSQCFFNSLPVVLPDLEYLIVKNEQKLNFSEFLLNFNSLKLIYVIQCLPIDLVEKLFHKYKKLIFNFVYHGKSVKILSVNDFKLEVENQASNSFESLDDLLTHLKFNLNF